MLPSSLGSDQHASRCPLQNVQYLCWYFSCKRSDPLFPCVAEARAHTHTPACAQSTGNSVLKSLALTESPARFIHPIAPAALFKMSAQPTNRTDNFHDQNWHDLALFVQLSSDCGWASVGTRFDVFQQCFNHILTIRKWERTRLGAGST